MNLISEEQTAKAIDLCKQLICNQPSTIYIHDSIDSLHFKYAACSVQSLKMQFDLSTLLISLGLVQYNAHLNSKTESSMADSFHLEKRIRKTSDEPIRKESWELLTIGDFKEFFDANKVETTATNIKVNTANVNDDSHRIYEIFRTPSKRNPFGGSVSPEIHIDANPLVDRITEYFSLLDVTESTFYCRPVYIIDPITVLIELYDAQPPAINFPADEQYKYSPLKGLKFISHITFTLSDKYIFL